VTGSISACRVSFDRLRLTYISYIVHKLASLHSPTSSFVREGKKRRRSSDRTKDRIPSGCDNYNKSEDARYSMLRTVFIRACHEPDFHTDLIEDPSRSLYASCQGADVKLSLKLIFKSWPESSRTSARSLIVSSSFARLCIPRYRDCIPAKAESAVDIILLIILSDYSSRASRDIITNNK